MREKLTKEEKAENRLIKRQWVEFVRRLINKGVVVELEGPGSEEFIEDIIKLKLAEIASW